MSIVQNLPQRHTEASFRFWEPVIADIVKAHPELTLLDPTQIKGRRYLRSGHLSFETCCARLRDAMLSLATYHWPTDQIKTSVFERIYPDLRIAQRPPHVLIGTKEAIASYDADPNKTVASASALVSTGDPYDLTDTPVDDNTFRLLCYLQHQRLLTRPLRLRTGGLSLASIVSSYDVDVEDMGDGTITLR